MTGPSSATSAAAIRRCGAASGAYPTTRHTCAASAVTGNCAMITCHAPVTASRSRVGTTSSRIAQATHACSTLISTRSSRPRASETVRTSSSRSGSISWRTTTADGRSHCRTIVAADIGSTRTPLTRTTGTRFSS